MPTPAGGSVVISIEVKGTIDRVLASRPAGPSLGGGERRVVPHQEGHHAN